jgi:hypothetical protein
VLQLAGTFRQAAKAFQQANASGTAQALAASSRVFSVAASQFATQLGNLTPPANVANAQGKLVTVVHTFARDLGELSTDAAANNIAAMKRDTRKIESLQPKLAAAEHAVNKK